MSRPDLRWRELCWLYESQKPSFLQTTNKARVWTVTPPWRMQGKKQRSEQIRGCWLLFVSLATVLSITVLLSNGALGSCCRGTSTEPYSVALESSWSLCVQIFYSTCYCSDAATMNGIRFTLLSRARPRQAGWCAKVMWLGRCAQEHQGRQRSHRLAGCCKQNLQLLRACLLVFNTKELN